MSLLDHVIQRIPGGVPTVPRPNPRSKWMVQVIAINGSGDVDCTLVFIDHKQAIAAFNEAEGALGTRWSDVIISKIVRHVYDGIPVPPDDHR